jgi:hypothetical protein
VLIRRLNRLLYGGSVQCPDVDEENAEVMED